MKRIKLFVIFVLAGFGTIFPYYATSPLNFNAFKIFEI